MSRDGKLFLDSLFAQWKLEKFSSFVFHEWNEWNIQRDISSSISR